MREKLIHFVVEQPGSHQRGYLLPILLAPQLAEKMEPLYESRPADDRKCARGRTGSCWVYSDCNEGFPSVNNNTRGTKVTPVL